MDVSRTVLIKAITPLSSVGQGGMAMSASNTQSTTSTSPLDLTGLQVTVVTGGNPVEAYLVPDGASQASILFVSCQIYLRRSDDGGSTWTTAGNCFIDTGGAANKTTGGVFSTSFPTNSLVKVSMPPGLVRFMDTNAATGSHIYKIEIVNQDATNGVTFTAVKLFVKELCV